MTEEEFTALSIDKKWLHLKVTMDYITRMDSNYSLRRRMNPHHPKEQQIQEQRSLRVDQYQRWAHLKNLYGAHRNELSDTLGSSEFEECKSIIERIFTVEVDDALRDIIGDDPETI